MLKTAIIGAGDISKPHAKAISDLGIGIAGVLDYNSARSKELADKYGGKVIQKLDEVLDEVDMVHIFTPPSQRVEYVRKAAEAGKHIFIEKPIAISIEDAREIVSLAKEYKVKLLVGFNQRFRTGYCMLHDAVKSGRLGEVISVFSNRFGAGAGFRGAPLSHSWRTDPQLVCGMSIESVSHDIDMLLHLVNGVESVSANTYCAIKDIPNFDNNASITFRLNNGGIGSINASWSSDIGYSCRGVIGTKGTAMISGDDLFNFNDFVIKTDDMPFKQITRIDDRFEETRFSKKSSYVLINQHFKDCIEMNTEPISTGEDGLRALIFSHAVLESSRNGKVIELNTKKHIISTDSIEMDRIVTNESSLY